MGSHPLERLLEVGFQVLDVLDAHRQPYQPVGDAEGRASSRRGPMRASSSPGGR